MKNITRFVLVAAIGCILAIGTTGLASAQRSGGGGGGSSSGGGGSSSGGINRHGGSFNLVFDHTSFDVGSHSSCVGGYNLTTYVTTLSIDYKCSGLDLPDGTLIYATVYSTDYYTGLPWAPMDAGVTNVQGGKAVLRNPNVVTTGVNGLPVFRSIQLSLADGTVIFVGHP